MVSNFLRLVGPDYTDDIQRVKPQSDTNIILSVDVPAEDETCCCVCLCVRLLQVGMMGQGGKKKKRERDHILHTLMSAISKVFVTQKQEVFSLLSASFNLTRFLSASVEKSST